MKITQLIKSNKMDFLTSPNSLLTEIRETMILDCTDIASIVQEFSDELFLHPVLGVYKPNSHVPLFTAHETLYTHESTFEYFPEISSQFVSTKKGKTSLPVTGQVGTPIPWRDAVEKQVNVYNAQGNLVLRAKDKRENFVFNPKADVYARQFVLDMTKYFIYKAVPWGEIDQVVADTGKYALENVDVEATFEKILLNLQATNYFKTIKSFVDKDPYLVYHINNIGNNILVESGCDFRHFKCNQLLWNQLHATDVHSDVFETFRNTEEASNKIKFENLGSLFNDISKVSGVSVNSLTEFYKLRNDLDRNVKFPTVNQNSTLKETISKIIDEHLQRKDTLPQSPSDYISKLMKQKNARHNSFDFNQAAGVYIL